MTASMDQSGTIKTKRLMPEYTFLTREGSTFTGPEQDDLVRLVAAMILRDLRYKKKMTIIPNQEDEHG